MKNILKEACEKVSSSAEELSNTVKSKTSHYVTTARDGIADTADEIIDAAFKMYAGILSAWETMKAVGITVSFIAAPVPTAIGLIVLWIMEESLKAQKTAIDEAVVDSKKKRKFDRAIKQLKDYGAIPQTSILETAYVKLEVDSLSQTADGYIKQGEYKNKALSDLTEADINKLIENTPEKETGEILSGFKAFSNAQNN